MKIEFGKKYYFKSANEWDLGLFRGELTGEVLIEGVDKVLYTFKNVERSFDGENGFEYEIGEFKAFADMIFPAYEQLAEDIDECHKENVQRYYDSIKTLHDLITFPLENCIGYAEEYTDWTAREAYIKRAKDFGFECKEE